MLKESKEIMHSLGSAEKLGIRNYLQRFQRPEEKHVLWGVRGCNVHLPHAHQGPGATKSGDSVPQYNGPTEWSFVSLLLKPPWLCPWRPLRDRTLPLSLHKRRLYTDFPPGGHCL